MGLGPPPPPAQAASKSGLAAALLGGGSAAAIFASGLGSGSASGSASAGSNGGGGAAGQSRGMSLAPSSTPTPASSAARAPAKPAVINASASASASADVTSDGKASLQELRERLLPRLAVLKKKMAADDYESLRLLVKNSKNRMGSEAEVSQFVCAFMPLVAAAVGGSTAKALCSEFAVMCDAGMHAAYAAALESYCGRLMPIGQSVAQAVAPQDLPPPKRSRIEGHGAGGLGAVQLMCCVCHAHSLEPYAAQCGHLCCGDCWTRLLRVRSQCPLCQKPVDKDEIVRIVLRGGCV